MKINTSIQDQKYCSGFLTIFHLKDYNHDKNQMIIIERNINLSYKL